MTAGSGSKKPATKFGIFLIGDSSPELNRRLENYYDAIIEQVVWADKLGYECFWFGEHHFDFFGVIPSPPVIMAAAAKATEKIRIGVAVSLLPYRNPILVAEEYAMVDVLSGGRLDFGVGRGTPDELRGFGVKEDNRNLFIESLEVVEMAWRRGKVLYNGRYHKIGGVALNVGPLQKPNPPIFVACLSDASYKFSAERGYPILGIPYASCNTLKDVKEKTQYYKDTLEASGHDPRNFDVVQCFHTHVAESDSEAERRAREPLSLFYAQRYHIRPRTYDELLRDRMLLVGDPKRCREHIDEIVDTGANYLIFMMNFAAMEQRKILDSMEIMAKEVLPSFV